MENLDPLQIWLLMAAVAYIAFMAGRATSRRDTGESREMKALRIQQAADEAYSGLTSSSQEEVDRLIRDGKIIQAVKVVRENTGFGLKESKDTVDQRRRMIKG